jgi:hypothetical protein
MILALIAEVISGPNQRNALAFVPPSLDYPLPVVEESNERAQ